MAVDNSREAFNMRKRVGEWILRAGQAIVLLVAMTVAHASPTLYERIGGEAKLKATVDEFSNIILADDRINFTFADSDMNKFKKLLFEQICALTQGPCTYTGRNMYEAHKKLNLNNAQFNALAEDLYIAFDRVHVPYRLQNKVVALLAPMQRDIVKPGFVAPGTQKPPSNVR
jgi:hemoglobin